MHALLPQTYSLSLVLGAGGKQRRRGAPTGAFFAEVRVHPLIKQLLSWHQRLRATRCDSALAETGLRGWCVLMASLVPTHAI